VGHSAGAGAGFGGVLGTSGGPAARKTMYHRGHRGSQRNNYPEIFPSKKRGVTLSAVEELGPAEIAEVLETSESAVRSRMFRARQVLKEKLQARLEGKHGT